ncbi:MAG: hypothetical protein HY291_09120 [Planctomycetes bacterium]|nr:hypothetical protein [Planctomycetota bacterium]
MSAILLWLNFQPISVACNSGDDFEKNIIESVRREQISCSGNLNEIAAKYGLSPGVPSFASNSIDICSRFEHQRCGWPFIAILLPPRFIGDVKAIPVHISCNGLSIERSIKLSSEGRTVVVEVSDAIDDGQAHRQTKEYYTLKIGLSVSNVGGLIFDLTGGIGLVLLTAFALEHLSNQNHRLSKISQR